MLALGHSGPRQLLTCGSGRHSVCRAGPRTPAACGGTAPRPVGESSCLVCAVAALKFRTRTVDLILGEGARKMTRSQPLDSALNLLRVMQRASRVQRNPRWGRRGRPSWARDDSMRPWAKLDACHPIRGGMINCPESLRGVCGFRGRLLCRAPDGHELWLGSAIGPLSCGWRPGAQKRAKAQSPRRMLATSSQEARIVPCLMLPWSGFEHATCALSTQGFLMDPVGSGDFALAQCFLMPSIHPFPDFAPSCALRNSFLSHSSRPLRNSSPAPPTPRLLPSSAAPLPL